VAISRPPMVVNADFFIKSLLSIIFVFIKDY